MVLSWIAFIFLVALTVVLAFAGRRPTIEEIEAQVLSDKRR